MDYKFKGIFTSPYSQERPNHPAPQSYTAREIFKILASKYGHVAWKPRLSPFSELIATILSQHTSDLNSERAFKSLGNAFPTWEDVLICPVEELMEVIRSGGLARQKALRIQAVLKEVLTRCGGFDLNFLGDMPLDSAKQWLQSLPGVGPKTAAIVLSFSLGLPALPVDTHVHRVAKRLALITPKTNADLAHEILESMIPPKQRFAFHVYLINHGRQVCKAQRPNCDPCVLNKGCPSSHIFIVN